MRRLILGLMAGLALAGVAQAEDYPSKPVTIIVPYAAGSGMDSMSRVIAQGLSDRLKQPMLIDNKAGANGTLGAAALTRSTPDGYTLGMGNAGTHSSSPHLMKSVPYDPVTQFMPVGRIGSFVFMLVVNAAVPAKSLQELVAYSKENPGKLTFAVANSVGLATVELLKKSHGLNVTAVPYRSMPQAVTDLIASRLSILLVDRGPILPHLQSGAVRALMVTTSERSRLQPDVPSSREAGSEIDINSWVALFAPVGTPHDIISKVSAELREVVEDPATRDRLSPMGFETRSGGPEQVAVAIKTDLARWQQIVKDTGIEPQ